MISMVPMKPRLAQVGSIAALACAVGMPEEGKALSSE
jgi:hypothetical protein